MITKNTTTTAAEKEKLVRMFLMSHDMYDNLKKRLTELAPIQHLHESLKKILNDSSTDEYEKWLQYRNLLVKLGAQVRGKPIRKTADVATQPNILRNKKSGTVPVPTRNAQTSANLATEQILSSNDTLQQTPSLESFEEDRFKQNVFVSARKKANKLQMRAHLRNEQGLEEHETVDAEDVEPGYEDHSIFLTPEQSHTSTQKYSAPSSYVPKNIINDLNVDGKAEKSTAETKKRSRRSRSLHNGLSVDEIKLLDKIGRKKTTANDDKKANKRAGSVMDDYYKAVKIPREQTGSGVARRRLFSRAVRKWEPFCK